MTTRNMLSLVLLFVYTSSFASAFTTRLQTNVDVSYHHRRGCHHQHQQSKPFSRCIASGSSNKNAADEAAATTSETPSTSTTTTTTTPLVVINGHNIALTTSLTEYINKRIGTTLSKLSGAVRECDVVLSVNKNPKVKNGHRVEIVTNVKGTTIICKNESPDMYTSIDSAASALQRKLVKYKERRRNGYHGGKNGISDDFATILDEVIVDLPDNMELNGKEKEEEMDSIEEGFIDVDKPKIVKVNSFQLEKGISLDEAIFALDYVDHDFYVFKNEATNQINVVYKRHTGGIGLVEP